MNQSWQKYTTYLLPWLTLGWIFLAMFWVYPSEMDRIFVYEYTRNYPRAIHDLSIWIAQDPSSRKMDILARLYVKSGKLQNAEDVYREADIPLEILDMLLTSYRARSHYEDVRRLLLVKQELRPLDKAVPRELTILFQQLKDYPSMIVQLEKLIALDPSDPEPYRELGDLYFLTEQDEKGMAAYHKRAELLNEMKTWRDLAQVYLYKKMTEQGLTLMQTIAEQYNHPNLWKELGELYAYHGYPEKSLEAYLHRARLTNRLEDWKRVMDVYLNQDKKVEGLALYETVIKPLEQPALWKELGDLYVYYDMEEKAFDAYKKRAELLETIVGWQDLANLYLYKQRIPEGMAIHQRLTEAENTPDVWKTLGDLYLYYGMTEEGLASYRHRAELMNSFQGWKALAQQHFALKKIPEGLAIYREQAEKNNDAAIWNELASLYVYYGMEQEMFALYTQLARQSNTIDAWKQLAQLYFLRKQIDEGLKIYQQTAESFKTPALWKETADLYFYYDRVDDGFLAQARYTESQDSIEAWKQLAQLYIYKKREKEGLQVYYLLAHNHQIPALWKEVANLYLYYGYKEEGLSAYERYVALETTPETRENLALLYLAHGKSRKGVSLYLQLAREFNTPELWQELANIYFSKNMEQSGLKAMENANQKRPELATTLRLAARMEYDKQLAGAENYFIQAISLYPEPRNGEMELIKFYLRQGMLEKAHDRMLSLEEQGLLTGEDQLLALKIYFWVNNQDAGTRMLSRIPVEQLPPENLDLYYKLAVSHGLFDKAIAILDYLELHAPSPELWKKRVLLVRQRGYPEQAVQIIQNQISHYGESLELLEALYDTYDSLHDPERVSVLHRILVNYPDNQQWMIKALSIYTFRQEYGEGFEVLRQRYERQANSDTLKGMLKLAIKGGLAVEAQTILDRVPEAQQDAEVESMAVDIGYLSGDLPWVTRWLERRFARTSNASDLDALILLYRTLKEPLKEITARARLVSIRPSMEYKIAWVRAFAEWNCRDLALKYARMLARNPRISGNSTELLAELLEYLGDPEEAIKLYNQQLKRGDVAPQIQLKLGTVLYAQGNYNNAIRYLEKGLQANPDDFRTQWMLLISYLESGQEPGDPGLQQRVYDTIRSERKLSDSDQLTALRLLLVQENYPVLFDTFHDFLKTWQNPSDLFYWFVEQLHQKNRLNWLLEDMVQNQKYYPPKLNYYQGRYELEIRLGQSSKALITLEQWVKAEPNNIKAWKDLAYSALQAGDRNRSLMAFGQVKRLTRNVMVSSVFKAAEQPVEAREIQPETPVIEPQTTVAESPKICPIPQSFNPMLPF
ncbi:MAG: tetratricopeptide repeat protein [SAR324 cluster bacterium]|nr:tetratricopeptide repeat protein [SAR324 cluster bacterium]